MADYFTQFSVMFPVGAVENVEPALALYRQLEEELDRDEGATIGFNAVPDPARDPHALWISSDCEGDPEHVIVFAKRCGEAFGLTGRWGFRWSLTCSRPLLNGHGGGAHVLDLATGDTIDWMDCEHWLASQLADDAQAPPAVSPISSSSASEAGRVLREASERHRFSMAAEPSLARLIDAEATELTEVADALYALLEHQGAITLRG